MKHETTSLSESLFNGFLFKLPASLVTPSILEHFSIMTPGAPSFLLHSTHYYACKHLAYTRVVVNKCCS